MIAPRVLALSAVGALVTACGGGAREPIAPPRPTVAAAPTPPPKAPEPPEQVFATDERMPVFTDPDRARKLATAFPEIAGIAEEALREQHAPGIAIGVVIDGELAYARGFGVVDLDLKTPPDADTLFRVASITKSFTGLTVLSLRDDGVLGLDDPLVKWVPEAARIVYPSRDDAPITLQQLLTHTSGLPRDGAFDDHNPDEARVTAGLAGTRLDYAPGERSEYSNLGFLLVGVAASHAAHTPYRKLVSERILDPLGMTSTVWDRAGAGAHLIATGYALEGGGALHRVPLTVSGTAEPAEGLYSNVRDMARYVAFQLAAYPSRSDPETGRIRRSTVREAHSTGVRSALQIWPTNTQKKGEPIVGMAADSSGFGWVQQQTCAFERVVWHNGDLDGFKTDIHLLPDRGVGVVVLTNQFAAQPYNIAARVLRALDKTGALMPRALPLGKVPDVLDRAMQRLLKLYDAWDDATYAEMLSQGRPHFPREKDEIAGYKALHGACSGYTLRELVGPFEARFDVHCERGAFQIQVSLAPSDGLVRGFDGTSTKVTPPATLAKLGDALLALVSSWDAARAKRLFKQADTKALAQKQDVLTRLGANHGRCVVGAWEHEGFDWRARVVCDRGGDMTLKIAADAVDPTTLGAFGFAGVEQTTTCPTF